MHQLTFLVAAFSSTCLLSVSAKFLNLEQSDPEDGSGVVDDPSYVYDYDYLGKLFSNI